MLATMFMSTPDEYEGTDIFPSITIVDSGGEMRWTSTENTIYLSWEVMEDFPAEWASVLDAKPDYEGQYGDLYVRTWGTLTQHNQALEDGNNAFSGGSESGGDRGRLTTYVRSADHQKTVKVETLQRIGERPPAWVNRHEEVVDVYLGRGWHVIPIQEWPDSGND